MEIARYWDCWNYWNYWKDWENIDQEFVENLQRKEGGNDKIRRQNQRYLLQAQLLKGNLNVLKEILKENLNVSEEILNVLEGNLNDLKENLNVLKEILKENLTESFHDERQQ